MAIQALLFDVHRTLVDDSGFPRNRIWRLMQTNGISIDLPRYYQRYDELVKQLFHWSTIHPFITIREIHRKRVQILYEEFGVKRDIEADLDYLWACMGTSQIYPEVPGVLNQLQLEYQTALVSNADNDDPLIKVLLKHGFRFNVITTSEAYQRYKPDPLLFEVSLQILNRNPENALVIGDGLLADVEGAKNAGVKSVWLNRNGKKLTGSDPSPDFEIKNLTELPGILEKFKS